MTRNPALAAFLASLAWAGPANAQDRPAMEQWSLPRHLRSLDQALAARQGKAPEARAFSAGEWALPSLDGIDTLLRTRVVLKVPEEGDYRFVIAGDDLAALYLSEDPLPLGKRLQSSVRSYTGLDDWKASRNHTVGAPVHLKKGQECYLESLCFNQGGTGHFEVGWQPPGAANFQRLPFKDAAGNPLLRPYQPPAGDSDDDELPDEWEKAKGLQIGKDPTQGADGDPDGDGASNREEYLAQTDPLKGEPLAGAMRTEVWSNFGDKGPEQLFRFGVHRLSLPATSVTMEKALEVKGLASQVFQRSRGFITVPVAGKYRLHLSGQGPLSLSLAPGGDVLAKREVIRCGSLRVDWKADQLPPGAFPDSGPVELDPEHPCFFEALLHLYRDPYFFKLEWTRPDGVREPVPMSAIRSYVSPFADGDQDDLPDEWEKAKGLEISGTNFRHFASGDPDFDGADNGTEYKAGTDPLKADSDGDGASDGEEISLLGTDPTKGDPTLGKQLTIDLFAANALNPGWSRAKPDNYESRKNLEPPLPDPDHDSLSQYRGCGSLEWKFKTGSAGFHLIRMQVQPVSQYETYEIGNRSEFWIDGKRLPDVVTYGTVLALQRPTQISPWLEEGEHVLRLRISPVYMATTTRIFGVEIVPVAAQQKDTVARHLAGQGCFPFGTGTSRTSPVAIGYEGRIGEVLSLNAGDQKIPMQPLFLNGGLAELGLSEDGSPLAFEVPLEGGAAIAKGEARWIATDVLAEKELVIASGDSLRLTATSKEAGAASILLTEGADSKQLAAGEAWIRKFDQAGEHTVKATAPGIEATCRIVVLAAPAASGEILARTGSATSLPGIPAGWEVEGGTCARAERLKDGSLSISPLVPGDLRLPLRTPGGSFGGIVKLNAFRITSGDEVFWHGPGSDEATGRMLHVVVDHPPVGAVLKVVSSQPGAFLPYSDKGNNDLRVPLSALGPEALATLHFRPLKNNARDWLSTGITLLTPDGKEY